MKSISEPCVPIKIISNFKYGLLSEILILSWCFGPDCLFTVYLSVYFVVLGATKLH